jgi:hypothetical protein
MSLTDAALPRPPRSPDFRYPEDVNRWTRELRDYLDRVYKALVQAALEVSEAQPLSPTLTALDGLSAAAGLLEQTGADTFTKRAIGVSAATSIPTRADADARYVQEIDAESFVVGPSSATDNAVARFDATTGKLVQDSPVTIDDDGVLAGFRFGTFTGTGDTATNGYVTITDAGGTTRRLATVA